MRNQRSFSVEFKRQIIEELLSGKSRPAQICRRYNIQASPLYHWKRQYSRGKFNNEPTEEGGSQGQDRAVGAVGRQAYTGERISKKGVTEEPQPVEKKREIIVQWGCFISNIRRGVG